MTVNTINYTVEANGVTPAVIKSGGVQGDHNVTKLVFSLPQSFVDVLFSSIPEGEKIYYRFDGYSGANVMRSTEAIELTKSGANGVELSYFLENWITKDGGNVVVNLVLVHINTDVETESELYCFPVSLSLKARSGRAAYNEAYKGVTSAELAAKEAAERAGIYEQGAISAMDQSSEYARKSEEQALAAKESADSAAEKLEEFKNFEKLSIDQTYNPESTNAQSGIAVAEAITPNHFKYFDITENGMIYLKPEYRGILTSTATSIVDLDYVVSDNGMNKSGSLNELLPKDLVIPTKLKGTTVSSFPRGAFFGNNAIETVTLPDTITTLPQGVFCDTRKLKEVINTNQITSLGNFSFQWSGIKHIELPNCTNVGKSSFKDATRLVKITIANNANSIGDSAFLGCENLVKVIGGMQVTTIPQKCFARTFKLEELPLLANVTTLGNYAFQITKLNYDWSLIPNRGVGATPLEMNSNNFWGNLSMTSCENLITTSLNQFYDDWFLEVVSPNSIYGSNLAIMEDGCVFFAIMTAYCALNKTWRYQTPFDWQDVCKSYTDESGHSALDYFSGYHSANGGELFGAQKTMCEKLGLKAEVKKSYTQENIQAIYNALAQGSYVFLEIPDTVGEPYNHAVILYGLNADKNEVLVCNSATHEHAYYNEDIKCGLTHSIPLRNLIQTLNNNHQGFIIISKQ